VSDPLVPLLRPGELIAVLEKLGFRRTRKSPGGHLRFGHADGRKTTVPFHSGKTIGRGLLRKILSDIGLSASDLKRYL